MENIVAYIIKNIIINIKTNNIILHNLKHNKNFKIKYSETNITIKI